MAEMIVLRAVHVLGGLFWVGSSLFNSFYLFPALAAAGPAAGAIMGSLRQRHLFVVMPTVALVTILAGLRLMALTSGGFAAEYFATGRGITFTASGSAAILAFLIGVFVGRPTGMRVAALRQKLATTEDAGARAGLAAEADALQRRSVIVGNIANMLLVIAAVGMAIGRYVP